MRFSDKLVYFLFLTKYIFIFMLFFYFQYNKYILAQVRKVNQTKASVKSMAYISI